MPKVIKKKTAKPVKKDDELTEVLSKARRFGAWRKELRYAAVAVPLILFLAAGAYFYARTTAKEAEALEYEGYKLLFGLYQNRPMPDIQRYTEAAENFKKSYKTKSSPLSLYYMAAAYYNLGKLNEALSALNELNQKFPDDERFVPLTYYKMATINLQAGKKDEALKNLETLYNYKSAAYKDLALMESARILDEMGKKDEARKKYETLKKEFSGSPFASEAEERLKG